MISIPKVIVLFCLIFALKNVTAEPNCPDPQSLPNGCICYESINRLVCGDIKEKLLFTKGYTFETIELRNVADLSLITDELHPALNTNNLIINLPKNISFDETKPGFDIESLLAIASESIHINSDDDVSDKFSINFYYLPPTVQSIHLANIKVESLNLAKFKNLKEFELHNVDMGDNIINKIYPFNLTTINRLVVADIKSEIDLITITDLNACPAGNNRVYIDMRNLPKLKSFDFASLKLDQNEKCLYHIDFSGSTFTDKSKELQDSFKELAKLTKDQAKRLYMIFRGTKMDCDKCMQAVVEKRKDYIHSIQCQNVNVTKNGSSPYLAELTADKVTVGETCTPADQ